VKVMTTGTLNSNFNRPDSSRINQIRSGAITGFIAWAAFGIVEAVLFLIPSVLYPLHLYVGLNAGFTALLMTFYALAGVVLGAGMGAFLDAGQNTLRTAATCSVLAVYAVLGFIYMPKPEIAAAFLACILIAGALLGLRRGVIGRTARGLGNPWVASILLLGSSTVALDYLRGKPRWQILAGVAAFMTAFYCLAWIAERFWPFRNTWNQGRVAGLVAALALITVLVSGAIHQQPLKLPERAAAVLSKGKPNILVITLDTVRADHLSLYGYERPTTPNLEQFARECVRYTNAFSASDVTLSTHASLFTGLYAIRHGAHYQRGFSGGKPLSKEHVTLAEILADRGYQTAAVVANPGFLSDGFGLGQGFGYYDQRVPTPFLGRTNREYSFRAVIRRMLMRFSVPRHYDQIARRAGEINDSAFEQLDRLKQKDRPFFLFINYMDAHWPYIPPEPFHTKYPGIDESFGLEQYFRLLDSVVHEGGRVSERQRRHLLSQYDGAITYLDAELGKLFTKLREMQLMDNTVVVITADHGEAFGERNLMEHGISVYQNQVHVPWLIRYPGDSAERAPRGSVIEDPISSVDLLPTIAEFLGMPPLKNLDGISLLHAPGRERILYSESYPRGSLLKEARFQRTERSAVHGQWKLITSTAGKHELYDIGSDAAEAHNLYQEQETVSRQLSQQLRTWVQKGEIAAKSGSGPDRQTMEMLKSLGYVQ
jgi:arylsulfatase A-like enzyme